MFRKNIQIKMSPVRASYLVLSLQAALPSPPPDGVVKKDNIKGGDYQHRPAGIGNSFSVGGL